MPITIKDVTPKSEKDEDEMDNLGLALFVKSLAYLLKDDEGIILHHEDRAFAVYKSSKYSTISIIEDEDYLEMDEGTMIWMHYEGDNAPVDPAAEPSFEDMEAPDDSKLH